MNRAPAHLTCPICRESFNPELSDAIPFCSHRCKQIDLGRWLGEQYGVPAEGEDEFDEPIEE